jgi:hypothetical protein
VIGGEAESLNRSNNRWLARCDLMNSVEKQVNLLAEMAGNKGSSDKEERTKDKEAEKKFEEGDDEEMEEVDLSKLINPCEKMMETRHERRWSERILKIAEEASKGGAESAEVRQGGNSKNHKSRGVGSIRLFGLLFYLS